MEVRSLTIRTSDEQVDYYPVTEADYRRARKYAETQQRPAMIHGHGPDEDVYCMDFDCESWHMSESLWDHPALSDWQQTYYRLSSWRKFRAEQ